MADSFVLQQPAHCLNILELTESHTLRNSYRFKIPHAWVNSLALEALDPRKVGHWFESDLSATLHRCAKGGPKMVK